MALDPRLNAYRSDLADALLMDDVEAARFVAGEPGQVIEPVVNILGEPRADARCVSQALFGEAVTVFDEREGWAWVQLQVDGYVGYVPSISLIANVVEPTHRVAVASTFMYAAPDIKAMPAVPLYMNSRVAVVAVEDRFSRLSNGRYVWTDHLAPLSEHAEDPVDIATLFEHAPYLWGGRTRLGLDCSGLVQASYHATGRSCPRDSDMQQALGEQLATVDLSQLRRGDLVFWNGHVGMMIDESHLIHSNGYHMMTVIEPVVDAVDRIARLFGPVTELRRPTD